MSLFSARTTAPHCQRACRSRSRRVMTRRKLSVHFPRTIMILICGFPAGSRALPPPPVRLCVTPNLLTTRPAWLVFTPMVRGSIAPGPALCGDRSGQALVGHLSMQVSGITIPRWDGPGSALIRGVGCLPTLGDGAFLPIVADGITSRPSLAGSLGHRADAARRSFRFTRHVRSGKPQQ